MDDYIKEIWKDLSGENDWIDEQNSKNLLDPLDNDLRKYLIHYGERIEAIYDALDKDTNSVWHGFPRYAPEDLFSNVGLEICNPYKYTVTNYVYAMLDVNSGLNWVVAGRPAWIGYVAVATDEGKEVLGRRDILICWRGTVLFEEWSKNFDSSLTSESDIVGRHYMAEFHKGFYSIYTSSSDIYPYCYSSARDQVKGALEKLMKRYKHEEISITVAGHSLGAALATLNAADIAYNRYNLKPTSSSTACLVTAFAFASPMVGNLGFQIAFDDLIRLYNLRLLRIRTKNDAVPELPPFSNSYRHVGKDLQIQIESKYLDIPFVNLPAISHNLEIYLHGIAQPLEDDKGKPQADGKEKPQGDCNSVITRDYSLVNKWLDVLKYEYRVLPKWWDPVKNKGLVQQKDGKWKVGIYRPEPPRD